MSNELREAKKRSQDYQNYINSLKSDDENYKQMIQNNLLLNKIIQSKNEDILEVKREMDDQKIGYNKQIEIMKAKITTVLSYMAKLRYDNDKFSKDNKRLTKRLGMLEKNYGFDIATMTLRPDWKGLLKDYNIKGIDHGK